MKKLSETGCARPFRPDSGIAWAIDTIAEIYKLTTAEQRVLSAVIESGGVRSVAGALGISQATVKTHLQSIFGKTGARRQIDLMKLVIAGVAKNSVRINHKNQSCDAN